MNEMHNGPQIDPSARYTLMLAMLIVRQMETTAGRTAVFAEITAKNRIIRWADRIYARAGTRVVRRLLISLYMLKCIGSVGAKPTGATTAVAMANFANEVHAIDRINALLPDQEIQVLRPSVRNIVKPAQIRAQLRFIGTIPRLWPLLGLLARRHSFMPACRISSALAFYIQAGTVLAQLPTMPPAIVASNYSPEALGLAAAAHRRGGLVIYANHAPVPRNSEFVPPVLADISILYGEMVRQTYAVRSRCLTHAIYSGQPGTALPMSVTAEPQTIGVFLTALTRKETIIKLIGQARDVYPNVGILIRHHPVSLLETDLSDVVAKFNDIRVTLGTPLAQDIAACDMIVCGNSGVILNALREGKPVAFCPTLDALPFDYIGLFEGGLVPQLDHWTHQTLADVNAFYQAPGWRAIMIGYDASYGADEADFTRRLQDDLRAAITSRSSSGQAAFHGQ